MGDGCELNLKGGGLAGKGFKNAGKKDQHEGPTDQTVITKPALMEGEGGQTY